MKQSALIATDLDRTMIYSKGAIASAPSDSPVRCVEIYDGKPASFMTVGAADLLTELAAQTALVPTTTRTIEQFQRIRLPGEPWRYAITSNGGNILVDGEPDLAWRAAVVAETNASGASLEQVLEALRSRISDTWVDKCRVADDLFCYLVVKLDALPADFLPEFGQWCSANGWSASQQGRKIYAMPGTICKSRAVAEVRNRLVDEGVLDADAPIVAAGDGALDAEMLMAADAAIRPRHGELESLRWQHPTVSVTERVGIEGGAEIIGWFAEQAGLRVAT